MYALPDYLPLIMELWICLSKESEDMWYDGDINLKQNVCCLDTRFSAALEWRNTGTYVASVGSSRWWGFIKRKGAAKYVIQSWNLFHFVPQEIIFGKHSRKKEKVRLASTGQKASSAFLLPHSVASSLWIFISTSDVSGCDIVQGFKLLGICGMRIYIKIFVILTGHGPTQRRVLWCMRHTIYIKKCLYYYSNETKSSNLGHIMQYAY